MLLIWHAFPRQHEYCTNGCSSAISSEQHTHWIGDEPKGLTTRLYDKKWRLIADHACCTDSGGPEKRMALMVVADDNFLIGLIVLLHSFYKNNRWFRGDIVIPYSDTMLPLTTKNREALRNFFGGKLRIVFRPVEDSAYQAALRRNPLGQRYEKSLFHLEMFSLYDYDRVVYIDTDTLCIGSLRDVFESTQPLSVVLDWWKRLQRSSAASQPLEWVVSTSDPRHAAGNGRALIFNGGFIATGKQLRNPSVDFKHRALAVFASGILQKLYPGNEVMQADQGLMNYLFKLTLPEWSIISNKYSLLKRVYKEVQESCGCCFAVFHDQSPQIQGQIKNLCAVQEIAQVTSFHNTRLIHFPTLKPWTLFHETKDTRFNVEWLWHSSLHELSRDDRAHFIQDTLHSLYPERKHAKEVCLESIARGNAARIRSL
jgi:lipopolysaccharide biosynthesis glycosyltransferase